MGCASVHGTLYDTGRFPACRDEGDEEARVHGEVWALRPEFVDSLMHTLDQYEGYAPDSRHDSLFLRVRDIVRYEDGSEQEAWVYRYNQPLDTSRRVASGDWLRQWRGSRRPSCRMTGRVRSSMIISHTS